MYCGYISSITSQTEICIDKSVDLSIEIIPLSTVKTELPIRAIMGEKQDLHGFVCPKGLKYNDLFL